MTPKPTPESIALNLSDYLGTVGQLQEILHQNPESFPVMFREMLQNPNARVRLRMGNAVEKAARQNPERIKPFKSEILAALETKEPEIIWHIALLLGYLELEEDDLALSVNMLFHWLDSVPHKFVKVNCLQTLAVLAKQNEWLKPEVTERLQAASDHESPAIRARARILLKSFRPTKKR